MNKTDEERLLDLEAEEAERHIDDPAPSQGLKRRPGTRKQVYSIRLAPEQVEQIERIAREMDIPASGLVRNWVLQALAAERPESLPAVVTSLDQQIGRLHRLVADVQDRFTVYERDHDEVAHEKVKAELGLM